MNSTFGYKTLLFALLFVLIAVIIKKTNNDTRSKRIINQTVITEVQRDQEKIQQHSPIDTSDREKTEKKQPLTIPPVQLPDTQNDKSLQTAIQQADKESSAVKSKYQWEWKGSYCGIKEPLKMIVTNIEQWENIWRMFTSNKIQKILTPEVDFTQKMILVLTMGEQQGSGYWISVDSTQEKGKNLIVFYRENKPEVKNQDAGIIPSQPYHMKVIPRNLTTIKFKQIRKSQPDKTE